MDEKSVELVLKKIIDIDKRTDEEVRKVKREISERESQLKSIIYEVEQNSILHQTQHGKKLYERILLEAVDEQEKIQNDCLEKLEKMDQLFNDKKSLMIERAFKKLSVDRWGS